MKIGRLSQICFSIFCLLLCAISQDGYARKKEQTAAKVIPTPGVQFVNQVMDTAFPVKRKIGYPTCFVLRFRPSMHPESQIVIQYNGKSDAVMEFGMASVPLSGIVDSGVADVQEAVQRMGVTSKTVTVPKSIFQSWVDNYWAFLGETIEYVEKKSESDQIQLDGTSYEVECYTNQNRIKLDIMGPELGYKAKVADPKIVGWMMVIFNEAERLISNQDEKK